MIRVLDLDRALAFFALLGLVETRRRDSTSGRFTLVFLATEPGSRRLARLRPRPHPPHLDVSPQHAASRPTSHGSQFKTLNHLGTPTLDRRLLALRHPHLHPEPDPHPRISQALVFTTQFAYAQDRIRPLRACPRRQRT